MPRRHVILVIVTVLLTFVSSIVAFGQVADGGVKFTSDLLILK